MISLVPTLPSHGGGGELEAEGQWEAGRRTERFLGQLLVLEMEGLLVGMTVTAVVDVSELKKATAFSSMVVFRGPWLLRCTWRHLRRDCSHFWDSACKHMHSQQLSRLVIRYRRFCAQNMQNYAN